MKQVMDIEQIDNTIEKISIYKRQEDVLFDELKQQMATLKLYYQSDNANMLDNIWLEWYQKSAVITQHHDASIQVLQKNSMQYKELTQKISNQFDQLANK